MAEEEQEREEKKGGGSFLTLLLVTILALAAGAGGSYALFGGRAQPLAPEGSEAEAQAPVEKGAEEFRERLFQLEPFVVNVSDEGYQRYLKIKMDALLEELASARRDEAEHQKAFGSRRGTDVHAALTRRLEVFAEAHGKRLSSAYQRRIDWIVRDTAVVEPTDVVETAAPGDLFWVFESSGAGSGWITWSRSLVFAWLQVAFGAPEPRGVVPARRFTAIERSFLARIARETMAALGEPLREQGFELGGPGALRESRDLLVFGATPFAQTQFEVRGFGDFGQVRLALPVGALAMHLASPRGVAAGAPRHAHRGAVFEAPVSVHAELGSIEISVEALASLRAGDVLPLRSESDGSLLLRVGDAPKFRALRGSVGERLAVQVTERIGESR